MSGLAGSLNTRTDMQTKGLADLTVLAQWVDLALKEDLDRRAVIFIDQFEEIFTQVAQESRARSPF